ncbi:MAG: hypothetical protein JNL75_07990 [Chitinophagales bacterium]|nr:hypothetical protein [Chitinophagales bacterium]
MTASQSLQIYEILSVYFSNKEDAKRVIESIERVVDEKVDARTEAFERLLNKDLDNLRTEMYKTYATKEDLSNAKLDIIKWMVGMWVAQMAAIVFLIIK